MTISASGSSRSRTESGAVLVGGHDQSVALGFEVFAQAQFAGHAAEKGAGLEIDRFGRRKSLAAGIVIDFGKIVARVGFRIAIDRIVVKNAYDLCHNFLPFIISLLEWKKKSSSLRVRPDRNISGPVQPAFSASSFNAEAVREVIYVSDHHRFTSSSVTSSARRW